MLFYLKKTSPGRPSLDRLTQSDCRPNNGLTFQCKSHPLPRNSFSPETVKFATSMESVQKLGGSARSVTWLYIKKIALKHTILKLTRPTKQDSVNNVNIV